MRIGCCARFFNNYEDEVSFAKEHNFDFMQLWYDKNGLALKRDNEPKVELINKFGFPTIVHAVLDINEFDEHMPIIRSILKELRHDELIIHPICTSEKITDNTIYKLSDKVGKAIELLKLDGVHIYLENNSLLDPIFTSAEEFELLFSTHTELNLLLDIAHIQSYKHLEQLVNIKKPGKIHIADKHFDVIHEHLPLGKGELDFEYIFNYVLVEFNGDLVIEVVTNNEGIVASRERIIKLWNN